MLDAALIYKLAIWSVPIVLAITLHEAGHAWAAYKLGDNTSKELGRVTLNPIPHIDIIGTIVLPLVMYLTSPILFGWAKPVPVNARNFKQPRKDMAIVALAGPFANFAMVLG
ncbi:MAG: site-2 protease family protein, partial [Pseudomonadota bacterium]